MDIDLYSTSEGLRSWQSMNCKDVPYTVKVENGIAIKVYPPMYASGYCPDWACKPVRTKRQE